MSSCLINLANDCKTILGTIDNIQKYPTSEYISGWKRYLTGQMDLLNEFSSVGELRDFVPVARELGEVYAKMFLYSQKTESNEYLESLQEFDNPFED